MPKFTLVSQPFTGLGPHSGRSDNIDVDVLWNPGEPGNFAMAESFFLCLGCEEVIKRSINDPYFGISKSFIHRQYSWDTLNIHKPASQPPLAPPSQHLIFMVDDPALIQEQIEAWGKSNATTVNCEMREGHLHVRLPEIFFATFEFADYSP